jgi:hypothetical protein
MITFKTAASLYSTLGQPLKIDFNLSQRRAKGEEMGCRMG